MPKSKFDTWQNYANQSNTFAYGVTSGSTDTTGSLVINYTLAAAPRVFIATPQTTNQWFTTTTNLTATGSTVRFFSTGSGNIGSTGVTASWLAWV